MKKSFIQIDEKNIPVYSLNTLVIGSGCAGFNAADWLYDLKVRDIAIVTEDINCGTSRNTGSDKQTYYKLSLSSSESDSVADMCKSLFEGKSVNGDTALTEAACSVKSFIKLANLGVPFPTNEYGEFVGYMTDHDIHKRATSAGPLTSKYMTEALQESVENKKIKIFDGIVIVKLLKDGEKIIGAIGIEKSNIYKENNGLVLFCCENIIMATGGPAGIYKNSVYPVCHKGMSSLAIEVGAECANLQEWQYGLASTDFRWNVSGTYQQVIPRYISVDEDGNEYEFLNDYFENPVDAVNMVFKKGYQWPFDSAKIDGSSVIDLIIYNETVNKNRSVYMDFRREPSVLEKGLDCLSEEAYTYLKNSDAIMSLPIKRLEKMNGKAINLYRNNGIDLYNEPLRVAVCAQHNNGGIAVNSNWETNIKGLYVAGEAAGTFGVYRPGGSALNSTQVGSMRAAEAIALSNINSSSDGVCAQEDLIKCGRDVIDFILNAPKGERYNKEIGEIREKFCERMSSVASHIRIPSEMKKMYDDVMAEYENITQKYKNEDICNALQIFRLRDMLLTQAAVLSAMLETAEKVGTRGGSMVHKTKLSGEDIFNIAKEENNICDDKVIITTMEKGFMKNCIRDIRPIPTVDLWFENVWNEYNARWNIG